MKLHAVYHLKLAVAGTYIYEIICLSAFIDSVCVCVCACVRAYVRACVGVGIGACECVYVCACLCVCACMCVCARPRVCLSVCICECIHVYVKRTFIHHTQKKNANVKYDTANLKDTCTVARVFVRDLLTEEIKLPY